VALCDSSVVLCVIKIVKKGGDGVSRRYRRLSLKR